MFYADNLEIPAWAEDNEGIKRMIASFQNRAKYHDRYDSNRPYVGHHILCFSQEDLQVLSMETIYQIVDEYIIDAGWETHNISPWCNAHIIVFMSISSITDV
jgi:hypothetical protein